MLHGDWDALRDELRVMFEKLPGMRGEFRPSFDSFPGRNGGIPRHLILHIHDRMIGKDGGDEILQHLVVHVPHRGGQGFFGEARNHGDPLMQLAFEAVIMFDS